MARHLPRPPGVLARVADAAIEGPIITSFTRIGYTLRRRLFHWRPLDDYDLTGRVVAVTGPTSGLGEAAARQLARMGADLVLIARDREKAEVVQAQIAAEAGQASIAIADLGDLESVRAAATRIRGDHGRLDALIHNAGALLEQRRTTPAGIEVTVAVHVVGPFLLTALLLPLLRATPGSRVITVSSGGMYAAGLAVNSLQMGEDDYRGTEQYARAKRAQVTLNELWAERVPDVRFHALHPGWADTPGVEASLPRFRKVVGPLLRDPQQGADTMIWLAADDGAPLQTTGRFWGDRRPRSIHKLPSTRRTDTPDRRRRLWDEVSRMAGREP